MEADGFDAILIELSKISLFIQIGFYLCCVVLIFYYGYWFFSRFFY